MRVTTRPPCQLQRGEMRRVPQNPISGLVAYHVCCPDCGFVSLAIQGKEGFFINEEVRTTDLRVSFSRPLQCLCCGRWIDISLNAPARKEDADVRIDHHG